MDARAGVSVSSGVNFAQIESEWVRSQFYSDFAWHAYDDFSPYNPLAVPLARARVAVVTTAGVHLAAQPAFDTQADPGDASYRAIPSTTALTELRLSHLGYDTARAAQDMNVVLPLDHLRSLAAAGRIGALAPTIYSFMGYVADTAPLIETTAPEVARRLCDERVDLVLLAPT